MAGSWAADAKLVGNIAAANYASAQTNMLA